MPKVSVIVPVYQVAPYVETCLRSVMAQRWTDLECIIVDDGSTDGSFDLCESLVRPYGGPISFLLLRHPANRGLSAARNTGTEQASGEYLFYLDGDDELPPDAIDRLMRAALSDPGVQLVQGRARTVLASRSYPWELREKNLPSHLATNPAIRTWVYDECRHFPVNAWNRLIRRDFLLAHSLFFREGIIFEDNLWTFYLLKYLSNIRIEPATTYIHYMRSGSIMTSTPEQVAGESRREIYLEKLQNLTSGFEQQELRFFANGFCLRYLRYFTLIPEFRGVLDLYAALARTYGCGFVGLKLAFTRLLGAWPFVSSLLQKKIH